MVLMLVGTRTLCSKLAQYVIPQFPIFHCIMLDDKVIMLGY